MKRLVGIVILFSLLLASCSNDQAKDKDMEDENKLPKITQMLQFQDGQDFTQKTFFRVVNTII